MYERTDTLVRNKFREHLLPTMLTTMAMSLASVVDGVIVGQLLGSDALAAIGLCAPVIYCINIIYMLFGVGGMTCASIARGKREMERANQLFTVTLITGVGVMVVFLIVMQALLIPVCSLLSAGDAEMAALTAAYLRPLLFTGPLLMFSSGLALFMRADGKPKSSALVVIVANAVNLVLDYVLIRFLNTDIMGAGLSTSLGYAAGVLVVLPYLLSRKQKRSFRFVRPIGMGKHIQDAVRVGLPKGFTHIASFGRAAVLNSLVMAAFGALGMSVMTVLTNVLMLSNIFIGGTGDTLLPIVGTLYGERDIYGVRKTVASARNVLLAACAVLVAFFMIFPQAMAGMFGLNTVEGLGLLTPALRLFSLYIPIYAAVITLQNFYNTTGREKFATAIAILDGFVFVCGFALLLTHWNPDLLWLCFACGSGATLAAILAISTVIRRKERVRGLLLIRGESQQQSQIWDITIQSTQQHAIGLSEKVIQSCRKSGMDALLSNHIGVAIEEMAFATAHYAHGDQPGTIDVMISANEEAVFVRFRDDGTPFDPVGYTPDDTAGLVTDGVALMKTIADDVSYSRQLGFNTTVLRFDREK